MSWPNKDAKLPRGGEPTRGRIDWKWRRYLSSSVLSCTHTEKSFDSRNDYNMAARRRMKNWPSRRGSIWKNQTRQPPRQRRHHHHHQGQRHHWSSVVNSNSVASHRRELVTSAISNIYHTICLGLDGIGQGVGMSGLCWGWEEEEGVGAEEEGTFI